MNSISTFTVQRFMKSIRSVIEHAIRSRPAHIRRGQAAFTTLFAIAPSVADEIRATPSDPFYSDERLPDFFAAIDRLTVNK